MPPEFRPTLHETCLASHPRSRPRPGRRGTGGRARRLLQRQLRRRRATTPPPAPRRLQPRARRRGGRRRRRRLRRGGRGRVGARGGGARPARRGAGGDPQGQRGAPRRRRRARLSSRCRRSSTSTAARSPTRRRTTDDDGNPAYTRMVLRIPSARLRRGDDGAQGHHRRRAGDREHQRGRRHHQGDRHPDPDRGAAPQHRADHRAVRPGPEHPRHHGDRGGALAAAGRPRLAGADRRRTSPARPRCRRSSSASTRSRRRRPRPTTEDDEAGFVTGFKAGWNGLTTFAVGLATALGALLPWLVVLAIVGLPTLLLLVAAPAPPRGSAASKPARTPSAA